MHPRSGAKCEERSGYFRSLERRCGDGAEGEVDGEIIGFLREAEVRVAQGETAGKICRGAGISATYYKWRREYGGLKIDQAKRLKELEHSTSG